MTDTGYDATRDPRTGRPVLPLDTENNKADAHSQPLSDEDNQGIAMGDDEDLTSLSEEEKAPNAELSEGDATASSAAINSSIPRMKAAESFGEESESDEGSDEVDETTDEPTLAVEKTEGERPEALAKFAEVARNDDGKPVRNGVEATADTAPIPTDSSLKQEAATRVLREGVLKQDQGADEAIDRLPDRTDAPGRRQQGQ
jgi:hypothetical protein